MSNVSIRPCTKIQCGASRTFFKTHFLELEHLEVQNVVKFGYEKSLVENYVKKNRAETVCGSFDQSDLQPLNNYRFSFFVL